MSYAFILQSFKLRTKTIHKTLNPVWDEELVYHGICSFLVPPPPPKKKKKNLESPLNINANSKK